MAYRKINVNGTQYEFVVGKSHTKIKKIGVFKNEDIGHGIPYCCDCCDETLHDLYGYNPVNEHTGVSPGDVKKVILSQLMVD